jgi:hypothetical protein
MNKKIIIFVAAAILIIIIGIFIFVSRSPKALQPASQITYSTNETDELSFNQNSGTLSRFNPNTNQFESVTRIPDKQVIDFQLSADSSSLFYTFDPFSSNQVIEQGINPEAQTLKVKSLNDQTTALTKENTFSAVWLDASTLIYQDISPLGGGKLVIYSLKEAKEIKRVDLGSSDQVVISPLSKSYVVVYDYSTDVGQVSSQIVNLDSLTREKFLSGNGLEIKTVPDSKYLAYQTASGEAVKTTVINWQTREKLYELNSPIHNLDWQKNDDVIYFVADGKLKEYNLVSKKELTLRDSVEMPIVSIKKFDKEVLVKTEKGDIIEVLQS